MQSLNQIDPASLPKITLQDAKVPPPGALINLQA